MQKNYKRRTRIASAIRRLEPRIPGRRRTKRRAARSKGWNGGEHRSRAAAGEPLRASNQRSPWPRTRQTAFIVAWIIHPKRVSIVKIHRAVMKQIQAAGYSVSLSESAHLHQSVTARAAQTSANCRMIRSSEEKNELNIQESDEMVSKHWRLLHYKHARAFDCIIIAFHDIQPDYSTTTVPTERQLKTNTVYETH